MQINTIITSFPRRRLIGSFLIYSLSSWLVLVALGLALGCLWRFWRPLGFLFAALVSLEDPMWSLGDPLDFPRGSLWGPLGTPWGPSGVPWRPLGAPWGVPWGPSGIPWGSLGAPWGAQGDFLRFVENWTPNSEQMCPFYNACA